MRPRMTAIFGSVAIAALIASLDAQTLVDEAPPADIAEVVKAATAAAEAGGTGPYKATMINDPLLPTHTLFRPLKLPKFKLPIIAWGNGACTNIGNRFRYYHTEVASHGFLILAVGPKAPPVAEWKVNITGRSGPPPEGTPPASTASQLIDAINWATAQNERKGSPYFHRLDTKAVAVAGQSCGGLQAIAAAADPRVRTVMIMNSGTFPEGRPPLAGTGNATKASLKSIHNSIAYVSGDPSDSAHKNAQEDYAALSGFPVLWAWKQGVGHAESYRQVSGGPFAPVAVAWLNWQLKGDKRASKMFIGVHCTLCQEPKWHLAMKGFK